MASLLSAAWALAGGALAVMLSVGPVGASPAPAIRDGVRAADQAQSVDIPDYRTLCRYDVSVLPELSGLATSMTHRRTVWAINDSGSDAEVFALSTRTCKVTARLRLRGVAAKDFEAIGASRDKSGRGVLWVGDIGDNQTRRDSVVIYRVVEPATLGDATVEARGHRIRYADGPRDAEALMVDPRSQQLWLVSKRPSGAGLYKLPNPLPSGTATARRVAGAGSLVTDAAISPSGGKFAIRDYFGSDLLVGTPPGKFGRRILLPVQVQGEAITWTRDGTALLVASERDPQLIRVALP